MAVAVKSYDFDSIDAEFFGGESEEAGGGVNCCHCFKCLRVVTVRRGAFDFYTAEIGSAEKATAKNLIENF